MTLRVSLLAVMMLASCALDEPASKSPEEGEATQALGGCGGWQCGTNSPQIANFGFWELASPTIEGVAGAPNNVGMQVLGFLKLVAPSTYAAYVPRVMRGKLVGVPFSTNPAPYNIALRGTNLIGGYFIITTPTGPYRITVKDVGTVRSWARTVAIPGLPTPPTIFLESYLLDWSDLNGEVLKNVCNNAGQRDDLNLMNGPLSFHTLLFEGDRIDAGSKRVNGVDTTWFNFGCAASTLAKMALTGHTEASRLSGTFNTSLAERQTMLKMLTADYCDDGTPFTVQGQPLNWADDHGTMKMLALIASPPRPVVREARWGPEGPVCLDQARVDVAWTPLGQSTFGLTPSVMAQAQAHCPGHLPPHCTGGLEPGSSHLITAMEPDSAP